MAMVDNSAGPMSPMPAGAPGEGEGIIPPGVAQQQQPQQADPAEQEQYERMLRTGERYIFGDGTRENVQKMLTQGGNPIDASARAAAHLVNALAQSAEKAGKRISEAAVLKAGEDLLNEILEIVVHSKLIEPQSKEQMDAITLRAQKVGVRELMRLRTSRGRELWQNQGQDSLAASRRVPAGPLPTLPTSTLEERHNSVSIPNPQSGYTATS